MNSKKVVWVIAILAVFWVVISSMKINYEGRISKLESINQELQNTLINTR